MNDAAEQFSFELEEYDSLELELVPELIPEEPATVGHCRDCAGHGCELCEGVGIRQYGTTASDYTPDQAGAYDNPAMRADVRELELGDRIAGPHSWTPIVTITAVGDALWQDPFGRVSRDVWGVVEATGDPIRLQIKPGVPIPLIREEL
jgi:hypothetical protein